MFGGEVARLREKMLRRGDQLITSALTLGEVLVKPMREGDTKLLREYSEVIPSVAVILPFDEKAATIYAQLRGDVGMRAPDAIQLACAAAFGVDVFVTNDAHLHNRQVGGIQFIVRLARVPI